MASRFPKDCWDKKCEHFHTWDMSVDDLVCACDILQLECDACDEDYAEIYSDVFAINSEFAWREAVKKKYKWE